MSLRVYYADSNPAVDNFAYRQSNVRAKELIESRQGIMITLRDGRSAVQLYRSKAGREQWNPASEPANASAPMGFLKFVLPESSKRLQRDSLITNVRSFFSLA